MIFRRLFKNKLGWIELTMDTGRKILINTRYMIFDEFANNYAPTANTRVYYPHIKRFYNIRETYEEIEKLIRKQL